MTILNPSFETPGINPGEANDWDEGYSNAAEDIAAFAHHDGYTRPWEDFEQLYGVDPWNNAWQSEFLVTDIVRALFDGGGKQQEDFESGWKEPASPTAVPYNQTSQFVYYSGNFAVAMFDTLADEFEDFEENWGHAPWNQSLDTGFAIGADPNLTIASFDTVPQDFEDFEEEWKDNETPGLMYTQAMFDGLTLLYDGFEGTWVETIAM